MVREMIREAETVKKRRSAKYGGDYEYINIATAFDIETTSMTVDERKYAFPYYFAFAVNDKVIHMRTMEEFVNFIDDLAFDLEVNMYKRLVVYVHNLPFEFKFINSYFDWAEEDIPFANGNITKVIKATTNFGVEFRCSLALTGRKLESLEEETGIPKMVGDLDYDLIRNSLTEMSEVELGYIENDVLSLTALINNRISGRDNIATIPMTSTGYVRRAMRTISLQDKEHKKVIDKMTTTPLELISLRLAFMGGYTHANPKYAFETISDVIALDIGSSYPAQIVSQNFPVRRPRYLEECDPESYLEFCNNHHVVARVTMKNVLNKGKPFSIISRSKAHDLEFPVMDGTEEKEMLTVDNGRLHSAYRLTVYVTEVDLYYYMQFYDFEIEKVEDVFVYESDYLPTDFLKRVIFNYKGKTELKDVEGREDDYNSSKEGNNGVYGMMVMDPIRPEFHLVDNYLEELNVSNTAFEDAVEDINKDKLRFLSYVWGVYVTAYARAQLYDMILKLDDAGVKIYYTDTDSVYVDNCDKVREIMNEENEKVAESMRDAAEHLEIDYDELQPKNPKGVRYPLGAWEIDGEYEEFKTLGAKRYACRTPDGKFSITCSGINKQMGSEYVESIGGMDAFATGLIIPKEKSGRNIARYSKPGESFTLEVTDYQGNVEEVTQKGWVHIETTESSLTVADEFQKFVELFRGLD